MATNYVFDENIIRIPVLPLRGLTIFPDMILHFDVGREKSIKALDEAMKNGQMILLVAQKDVKTDLPTEKDLYKVGTIAIIRQILKLAGGSVRVMIEGMSRAEIISVIQETPFFSADVHEMAQTSSTLASAKKQAYIRKARQLFETYAELAPKMTGDVILNVVSMDDDMGRLADYIIQNISAKYTDKQKILEEKSDLLRLKKVIRILMEEIEIQKAELSIQNKVNEQLEKNQKEYFLREQIKVIQDELGENDEYAEEINAYKRAILNLKLAEEYETKLLREASRLSKMQYTSPESGVIRTYLDTCIELPWNNESKERTDIAAARRILDQDHYGLEKVKERIIEFLAVRKLSGGIKGQVLCLIGPPGTGKTSVAKSVARAMGRKYARVSLGGVRDEADIRGHRKTYIGAMPGRILNAVKQAGTKNCVILLDEIDKLGNDFRGDPASALLEVLDTEQNVAFRDHYVEIPFDLSNVLFITTANNADTIPRPLFDRMEIIELTSYTDEEKLQIAKKYLIKKQFKKSGIYGSMLKIHDDAIRRIIEEYTKESGVRTLEREIARICNKSAVLITKKTSKKISVHASDLEHFLGVAHYKKTNAEKVDRIGVVNGLAWTSVGGELLEVEACIVPGTGKIELTGNLGDVMKESAKAALTNIRKNAETLGIDKDFYKIYDIHVHFPEGAIPKDGPSAGIATATAMISALTKKPVAFDIAMTGEITITGRVLPIGGLKEKTMAAFRNGIKNVIIPKENMADVDEIDKTVKSWLNIIPVSNIDEVLNLALRFDKSAKIKKEKMPEEYISPIKTSDAPSSVINTSLPQ